MRVGELRSQAERQETFIGLDDSARPPATVPYARSECLSVDRDQHGSYRYHARLATCSCRLSLPETSSRGRRAYFRRSYKSSAGLSAQNEAPLFHRPDGHPYVIATIGTPSRNGEPRGTALQRLALE